MIEIEREICIDAAEALGREWLETNGIGGYCSSSIAGCNTRRYHGLLVAATRPPLGRMVLLSKFEETLVIDGERFDLSTNRYTNAIHPEGFRYLTGFRLDPFPVWTFAAGGVTLERTVFMVHGENTTVCRWSMIDGKGDISLELRPLLAFRDHHHLRHEDGEFDGTFQNGDGCLTFRPYFDIPELKMVHNAGSAEPTGHWYRDFEYAIEQERGFDYHEDLFQPCVLTFDMAQPAVAIASTETVAADDVETLRKKEIKRRATLVARSGAKDTVARQLVIAADQFVVRRGEGHTVIAGYHWFSDWGRDTMIALPGLTLATKRPEIAKSILAEFARHVSQGMVPNRFPDAREVPDYNTVDATLWFFEAIRAYEAATGDTTFVRDVLYERLVEIIDWHVRGTRYGIRIDGDGLLNSGEVGTQLTWMDAKVGDHVITPRAGKPVEIQALWYNALCIIAGMARRFDERSEDRFAEMADAARASFRDVFWNEAEQCLYDVIDERAKDASVRPNQIFAVSLPYTMLDAEHARMIVDKVEAELLTPVGLRSLSPSDPRYVSRYTGSPADRDAAYHQGTVWAWLIGPFVDAYRKTHSADHRAERRVAEIIEGLKRHLCEAGIGQVSEVFDGDAPHTPRGCIAQAWSVAELLRIGKLHKE